MAHTHATASIALHRLPVGPIYQLRRIPCGPAPVMDTPDLTGALLDELDDLIAELEAALADRAAAQSLSAEANARVASVQARLLITKLAVQAAITEGSA